MNPSPPLIEASGLHLSRGGRRLLDNVSLSVAPGELLAIAGPNGAGKSTLLRLLSGEWAPDAGDVRLLGIPLREWDRGALARRRAVLPQESDLRFPFSVHEVVRLGRLPHGGPSGDRPETDLVHRLLRDVGLQGFHDRSYPTLSGGERQRVHLARILAQLHQPGNLLHGLLLLDEPTSSLDPAHQHRVLTTVSNLTRTSRLGAIAILHDLNLALCHATRILLLVEGRAVAIGPPNEVLTPENTLRVFGMRSRLVHIPELDTTRICLAA